MRRNRVATLAMLVAFASSSQGCGLVFGGTRQTIQTMSSPPGATVSTTPSTVDYTTPTALRLERKQGTVLTFSMPGYAPAKMELQREMRVGIVIADILLTGVIGVVVDAVTGAWYKLTPENANVTLTKQGAGPGPDTITIAVRATENGERVEIVSTTPGVHVDVATH